MLVIKLIFDKRFQVKMNTLFLSELAKSFSLQSNGVRIVRNVMTEKKMCRGVEFKAKSWKI